MGEMVIVFLVLGFLYKLSKLRVLHLEFGGKDKDDYEEFKEIKPSRTRKQLKK